ncbi:Arf guanine nucleotide exchange factor sbh1 [Emydomyces testavorans]|uniref:Arf guanine nucleotide exchange factor sbh1 n=1 Tax=Emydomyces testavorans TaxID=2070801 RepID=A0AAF0DGL6_9EURO|nr:Arf guanine nucleotide exchange factor sbh1 [Emydomyces testavorans]
MAKPRKSNKPPLLPKTQVSSSSPPAADSGNEAAKAAPNAGSGNPAASSSAASSTAVNRPSSPTPPGGPRTALRRRAAADHKESVRNARPASTRAAGAGGSSGTMLKLYTDESPGLKVDPVVVLVLSLGFIFSVVGLHAFADAEAV